MFLLDTNILSEMVRKKPNAKVRNQLIHTSVEDCYSSVISRYELRYGALLREDGPLFWKKLQSEILSLPTWLPVSVPVADCAASLAAELERKGQHLDTHDLLIAATAMEHNLTLITRNTKHFQRVTSLRLENWFV
ncbi:MAG: type II toxin-antitoxin system VapC family toxin [Candidatus Methylacidiphilales bacterium]